MSLRRDFLLEVGTEELPPKALSGLSRALGDELMRGLRKARLEAGSHEIYATPRRLAVLVHDLAPTQPDTIEERRGPALTAAFDGNGNPTPAASGFARSCGVAVEALEKLETDKGAWLVFRRPGVGASATELLPAIVKQALDALPVPRRMRWGDSDDSFVRPVHWLVMLYGEDIVPAALFGLAAGRATRGHRFHHPDALTLPDPAAYVPLLAMEGRVLADAARRREAVRAEIVRAASETDAHAEIDPALLDEVTSMVEWPVGLVGRFEARFLEIPEEALISVMKTHQKYFHMRDAEGRLLPGFVAISNIESRDPSVVRTGNERVIRPRLSDAMFFWTQDRRRPLEARLDGLKQVVFQRGLGSLYQKAERLAQVAGWVTAEIGGDSKWAERAGWLAKCDLATEMVGEFPELQGIMGRYYALHDGEPAEVAQALAEQYQPRGAGDGLPESHSGQALAIADKIDALVGSFGIGAIPSGDKDPFALRRAALGLLRIAIERGLAIDLFGLIDASFEAYRAQGVALAPLASLRDQLYDFLMDRLRVYYQERNIGVEIFESVLARRPSRPFDLDARIRAVEAFRALPEAESLAAANKRISNILKKAEEEIPARTDTRLFTDAAEKALAAAVEERGRIIAPLMKARNYTEVLKRLAGLRPFVDDYFDKVLVMSDDAAVRRNRLAQLTRLRALFLDVADLSRLSGQVENRG